MDSAGSSTDWNRVYALWHIPSSTLLVTTFVPDAVARRVRCVLTAGVPMDELMLQVTGEGELIGCQHLGASIVEALQMDPMSCLKDAEAS